MQKSARIMELVAGIVLASGLLMATPTLAATTAPTGLVIHAAEVGIGRFHRKDNSFHSYAPSSAWYGYSLPAGSEPTQSSPALQVKNADGSYTIFFSSLDELLTTSIALTKQTGQTIAIFNLEAHGMPGGMWYPKNQTLRDSSECSSWRSNAYGTDDVNYNQYYGPVEKSDIDTFRSISNWENPGSMSPCITGLPEWTEEIQKTGFAAALSDSAEIHFISCIVGLGKAGDNFTKGVAEAAFAGKHGKVLTSVNFGLGDWSIPEGMGFWDYINMDQLNTDNANYVKNHTDREIAQAGTVRIASADGSKVVTGLFGVPDKYLPVNIPVAKLPEEQNKLVYDRPVLSGRMSSEKPIYVRLPHTNALIKTH